MDTQRFIPAALSVVAVLCAFIGPAGPPVAEADDVHLPIVGRQFLVVGAEARGGPVLDWRGDGVATSTTIGPRARIGLQHVIGPRFSMNLEGSFGATYLDDHPMAPGGAGESQFSFDFTISAVARYMPIGPLKGWTFAGGLHYRRAGLKIGSLLQMGLDARIGYTIWTSDESFVLFELGLHAPVLEGVNLPQRAIQDLGEEYGEVPGEWYQPSASLGVQWAF